MTSKNRKIRIHADGRLFAGTAAEILTQMQSLAFGWDDRPLAEYISWLAAQMERQTGEKMTLPESDVAAVCEALVDAMVAQGLALEVLKEN